MSAIDNLMAVKILYKLVTPFDQTQAFKLGIIDEKGKLLIKPDDFKTLDQMDAYDYLDRLVFNIKRLLAKVPGGNSKIANLATAMYLIREDYELGEKEYDEVEFMRIQEAIPEKQIEEFQQWLNEEVPANSTGPGTSTDDGVVNPATGKDNRLFKKVARRSLMKARKL